MVRLWGVRDVIASSRSERCRRLRAFVLMFAVGRLFTPHVRGRHRPAQSEHHGEHRDIGSEKLEIAGHFAQFLTLAREIFRSIDGVLALGHPAGAGGECSRLEPMEPGALRVACKFPFDVLPASVVIRGKQFDVGHFP